MSLFGEKIKHLRELEGLLQQDVAQKLAIDCPMLSKIEGGQRKAKRELVVALSIMFNIAENELISIWIADSLYKMLQNECMALKAIGILKKQLSVK